MLVTFGWQQPFADCGCNMIIFSVSHDVNKFEEHCCKVSLIRGPGFDILKELSSHPHTWLSGFQNYHRLVDQKTIKWGPCTTAGVRLCRAQKDEECLWENDLSFFQH